MNLTIGHDSEFGLLHNGSVISALDVFDEQSFVSKSGSFFADNMNCEIAINPVRTLKDFHNYTEDLLGQIYEMGYDFLMEPTIEYPNKALAHKLAYISGCNPDYNAYTYGENKAPDFKDTGTLRSAGAHIHVGGVEDMDKENIIRWMDIYLGLPLLMVEKQTDRRSMYGAAGAFRPKIYGVEYRVLSNVWLSDPDKREFVWEATHKAVEMAAKSDSRDLVGNWEEIPEAIDTHNLDLARRSIDRLYLMGVKDVT